MSMSIMNALESFGSACVDGTRNYCSRIAGNMYKSYYAVAMVAGQNLAASSAESRPLILK
jgi:hypothetical protein